MSILSGKLSRIQPGSRIQASFRSVLAGTVTENDGEDSLEILPYDGGRPIVLRYEFVDSLMLLDGEVAALPVSPAKQTVASLRDEALPLEVTEEQLKAMYDGWSAAYTTTQKKNFKNFMTDAKTNQERAREEFEAVYSGLKNAPHEKYKASLAWMMVYAGLESDLTVQLFEEAALWLNAAAAALKIRDFKRAVDDAVKLLDSDEAEDSQVRGAFIALAKAFSANYIPGQYECVCATKLGGKYTALLEALKVDVPAQPAAAPVQTAAPVQAAAPAQPAAEYRRARKVDTTRERFYGLIISESSVLTLDGEVLPFDDASIADDTLVTIMQDRDSKSLNSYGIAVMYSVDSDMRAVNMSKAAELPHTRYQSMRGVSNRLIGSEQYAKARKLLTLAVHTVDCGAALEDAARIAHEMSNIDEAAGMEYIEWAAALYTGHENRYPSKWQSQDCVIDLFKKLGDIDKVRRVRDKVMANDSVPVLQRLLFIIKFTGIFIASEGFRDNRELIAETLDMLNEFVRLYDSKGATVNNANVDSNYTSFVPDRQAMCLSLLGRLDEAYERLMFISHYNPAYAPQCEPVYLAALCRSAIDREDAGAAEDCLKRLKSKYPDSEEAAALSAEVALIAGRPGTMERLREALDLRDADAAGELLQSLIARNPSAPEIAGLQAELEALRSTGRLESEISDALLIQDADTAEELLGELIEKDPGNPRTMQLSESIRRVREETNLARSIGEAIASRDPGTAALLLEELTRVNPENIELPSLADDIERLKAEIKSISEAESDYVYTDEQGWSDLALTEDEAAGNVLKWLAEGKPEAALAYLKAASELNPAMFAELYAAVSKAALSPMDIFDYSTDALYKDMQTGDGRYALLREYCAAAACLYSIFSSDEAYIRQNFTGLRGAYESVFGSSALLGEVCDMMLAYRDETGYCPADFMGKDLGADALKQKLKEVTAEAHRLWELYSGIIPVDNKVKRFSDAKMVAMRRDMPLIKPLMLLENGREDELLAFEDEFTAGWLNASGSKADRDKANAYIELCWEKAQEMQGTSRNASLVGGRRNNFMNIILSVNETVRQWYALKGKNGVFADVTRFETARSAAAKLSAKLIPALRNLIEEMGVQTGEAQADAGRALISMQAANMLYAMTGEGTDPMYMFVPFLRGGEILLDENWLPELDATLCALPGFNVLARIRSYAETEHMTLEERLADITSSPEAVKRDYGSARLIHRYLTQVMGKQPEELRLERFENAADVQSGKALTEFRRAHQLAAMAGQLIGADSFPESVDDILGYWRDACAAEKNFGFFHRLKDACTAYLDERTYVMAKNLATRLDDLIAANPSRFAAFPEAEGRIRATIEQKEFTIAEDLMAQVIRGTYSDVTGELDAPKYFAEFLDGYERDFNIVRDAGTGLQRLLGVRHVRNRDMRGGQMLLNNWFAIDRSTGRYFEEAMNLLLLSLGWRDVTSSPIENAPTAVEMWKVTRSVAVAAGAHQHSIADFGSKMDMNSRGFDVIVLRGRYDCDRLLEAFRLADSVKGGARLVLLDCALTMVERRKLARKLRQSLTLTHTYLVLDRVMVKYLIDHYNGSVINRMLMAVGMPYAYYQPYVRSTTTETSPEIFIGRERELAGIKAPSTEPNTINLVYGGRQLGKSELLRRAASDVNSVPGQKAVTVSVHHLGREDSASKIWMTLVDEGVLTGTDPITNWDSLMFAVKQYLKNSDYLLLLIDEADDLIAECMRERDQRPLNALMDLQRSMPDRFKFVLVGLKDVVRYNREALRDNADYIKLNAVKIKPFTWNEAMRLMREPLSYLGMSFEDTNCANSIAATANYFPGLIQDFCSRLIESLRESDYGGFQEGSTPPYVMSYSQISRLLTNGEYLANVHSKVEATLDLDDLYKPIAQIIALSCFENPGNEGCTADDIIRDARSYNVSALVNAGSARIDALLDELYELNILTRASEGRYRFTYEAFREHMGTLDYIMKELSGDKEGDQE